MPTIQPHSCDKTLTQQPGLSTPKTHQLTTSATIAESTELSIPLPSDILTRTPIMKTNLPSTKSAVDELMRQYKSEWDSMQKPMVFVSGSSISGYCDALALQKEDCNILIVGDRLQTNQADIVDKEKFKKPAPRNNVLSLHEAAIYWIASISPNASLLRSMLKNKLLTISTKIIKEEENGKYSVTHDKNSRLVNWLLPKGDGLPQRIPCFMQEIESNSFLALQDFEWVGSKSSPPQ